MVRRYRFSCPSCGERIVVDEYVRDELLAQGCVLCSSSVQTDCFELV